MLSSNTSAVSGDTTYIEDVFSTYLYTGTGANRTITNNIDLSTKGGLVWIKKRNAAVSNLLFDTARGANNLLISDSSIAAYTGATDQMTGFTTSGFNVGTSTDSNGNGDTFASWTFRKQPKFFDVVTFNANNSTATTVTHALASTPGCIIIKKTDGIDAWWVYHRSIGTAGYVVLNSTNAQNLDPNFFTSVTSTTFTTGAGYLSTGTYVAYLFAHDAGGFGLTGTDNVISCGSYTGSGAGTASVTLGYEPQWLLIKNASSALNWNILDTTRGLSYSQTEVLRANTSEASVSVGAKLNITPTGFKIAPAAVNDSSYDSAGNTYIYIAIRRGPMKVPTDGTTVFKPIAQTGDSNLSVGFPTDFGLRYNRAGGATIAVDRLRGAYGLYTPLTDAESAASTVKFDQQNLMTYGLGAGASVATYQFRRAPSFFDEVCYTGTGAAHSESHNLGVAPTLLITKTRSTAGTTWFVYNNFTGTGYDRLELNTDVAATTYTWANNAGFSSAPTSTALPLSTGSALNTSGRTYVAYLFATCAGVSKVGSYTGTGSNIFINCGFTGGARFVLIKCSSDGSSNWFVLDTARGMVYNNNPALLLNSNVAELTQANTGTQYVYTTTGGFTVAGGGPRDTNQPSFTYIYLAIA